MSAFRRLLLLHLSMMVLLAACGGAGEQETVSPAPGPGEPDATSTDEGSPPPATAPAGELDPAGHVRIAWKGAPNTFDPHTNPSGASRPYIYLVYDRLIFLTPQAELAPMLASDWRFDDSGGVLTLELRQDVSFHDGTPFNAEAVKVNLERAKTVEGSTVASSLQSIEEVVVVDDYTVDLVLNTPDATVPWMLATDAGVIISPAAIDNDDIDVNPEGSGPFIVDRFLPGDRVIFRAADTYWEDGVPRVETLELIAILDDTTRTNALVAGEVDVINVTPSGDRLAEARALEASGDYTLHEFQGFNYLAMFMNTDRSEFVDVRVRQAVAHAIDKQAIAADLLSGACTPTSQPFPEGYFAHNPAVGPQHLAYDPDRARALLAEAGLADGFEFELYQMRGIEPAATIAEVIQGMLAEVGIVANVIPLEPTEVLVKFRADQTADAFVHSNAGAPDASGMIQIGDYLNNPGGVAEDIDQLVKDALDPTLTLEERGVIYQDAVARLADEVYHIPLCASQGLYLADSRVVGVGPEDMSWVSYAVLEPRYVGILQD